MEASAVLKGQPIYRRAHEVHGNNLVCPHHGKAHFSICNENTMESEQRSYPIDPHRNYVEVNPAIIALRRGIVGQYERLEVPHSSSLEAPKESSIQPSQEVSNGMLV